MTAIEIKTAISKGLDFLPEESLNSVLDLVNMLQERSPEEIRRDQNFEKILADNHELLQRLAQ